MKKLLICFLLIVWGSVVSSAQKIKRELHTEEDGYKWYETKQGSYYGAESLDGKTLIPLLKKYMIVTYTSPYLMGALPSGDPEYPYKLEYYTKDGKRLLSNSGYDNVFWLGGKDDEPSWFGTLKNGKQGACDVNGNEIIPPIFAAVTYSDGVFKVKDDNGEWAEYTPQATNFDALASTSSNTLDVKELFELAYNTPDADTQTKYNRYVEVIQADPDNSYGYNASVYNNIGVLYEGQGDLKNAKICFENALQIAPNDNTIKENLKRVKAQRRSEQWDNVANILGALGEAASTMSSSQTTGGTYNAYQESGNSYSSSSESRSSSKTANSTKSQKNNHANWKALDNAYGNYETQLIKMKSSGNYDKQDVKNIQSKMKDIRKKIKEQSGHDRAVSSMENWNP